VQFLGDRRGEILALQKALGTLPAEQRRDAGRAFNDVKTKLTRRARRAPATLSRGAAKVRTSTSRCPRATAGSAASIPSRS
jgi:hypothetical protein